MGIGQLIGWGLTALIAFVLGGSWALDTRSAQSVRLEVNVTPSTVPADGVAQSRLTVRSLNANGSSRAGDTIEVLAQGAGAFDRFRALTDQRGQAVFVFIAARGNKYRPTAPVPVIVTNSSLGTLVEVSKTANVTINVVEPGKTP